MANRLELTQAYHKVSGSTLEAAAQAARSSFLNLGSWREDDIPRFIEQVVPAMNSAKRNMANYATNYYKEMAGLAGEKFKMPKIDPASLTTEALRNGATEDMIWSRPFKSMWTSLSKGNDISDALDAGARRAVDLARTDVQLARRGAGLQARRSNDRIVGYLRTLSGSENCALCYVASTQRYKKKDLLPIHPGCDCGEMPIYGRQDPGQVIDEMRLDATHDAIETRFGIKDAGAREPDYRKIMIQDHGELGPVLTVKGDKFTKLKPAKVDVPIKAPKKVEPKPFAEQIKKKTEKLSGTKIQADILEEYNTLSADSLTAMVESPSPWGKAVGAKASKHVDDILDVGKRVDQEVVKRVDDAIAQASSSEAIAERGRRITQLGRQEQALKLELEAGAQKYVADELANLNIQVDFARQRLVQRAAEGNSVAARQLQIFNDQYTPEYKLKIAAKRATEKFFKLAPGKRVIAQLEDVTQEINQINSFANGELIPGSPAYEKLFSDKAKEVLAEVRSLGAGGPEFRTTNKQLKSLIAEAKTVYPDEWLEAAQNKFPQVTAKKGQRGYWRRDGVMQIDNQSSKVGPNGLATTIHEMGHMMEDSVPGIKELEWAFWRKRADRDPRKVVFGKGESGPNDEWRSTYTGRLYGSGPTHNYEVFTTGIESVFAGADSFNDTNGVTVKRQKYRNLNDGLGLDTEFRQFILGVLFTL